MRTVIALVLAFCSALAFGQSSKARIDAIWVVASNRMVNQQDAWFDDGDFPACISLLKIEAEHSTDDYEVWTNLGWMLENIQDNPDALATYVRFRELNPNDPDRALPEATYYFMKKQYDQVPALLEPVVKHKCHPNNYRVLAWAYEREKKYADAVRIWKIYVDVAPKDPKGKLNIAKDEEKIAAQSSR